MRTTLERSPAQVRLSNQRAHRNIASTHWMGGCCRYCFTDRARVDGNAGVFMFAHNAIALPTCTALTACIEASVAVGEHHPRMRSTNTPSERTRSSRPPSKRPSGAWSEYVLSEVELARVVGGFLSTLRTSFREGVWIDGLFGRAFPACFYWTWGCVRSQSVFIFLKNMHARNITTQWCTFRTNPIFKIHQHNQDIFKVMWNSSK